MECIAGSGSPDRFNGTAVHVAGTFVNDVGWTPTLYTEIHPAQAVPGLVLGNAGPFKEE